MKIWTKVEEPISAKVIIPYTKKTKLLQNVIDSLRVQFVQPIPIKLDTRDHEAYWKLISRLWQEGEEFFIVEQDIIAWPGAINVMMGCLESWCTLPSLCHGRMMTTSFGCIKFGQYIIDNNPSLWDEIAEKETKVWSRLDAGFANIMGWPDRRPCVHFPAATHLNEVQWPDSISKRGSYKKIYWQLMEKSNNPIDDGKPIIKINDTVIDGVDSHEIIEGE